MMGEMESSVFGRYLVVPYFFFRFLLTASQNICTRPVSTSLLITLLYLEKERGVGWAHVTFL